MRQDVLRQEQLLLAYHAALAAEPQHADLIVEIPGSTVPAVVYCTEARKRRVQTNNADVLSFLQPGTQFVAAAYAKPPEIDDAEFCTAPLAQARDALQRLQVIVE